MHLACQGGNVDIVKYLIEQGCDPECKSAVGVTPLFMACDEGHLDVVKYLVTEHNCNPLYKITKFGINIEYHTPLHAACEAGHYGIVEFLLSSGKADKLMTSTIKPGIILRQIDKDARDDFSSWGGLKEFFTNFFACRRSNPFHPAFKVFVMGNPSAGKSTLVKAIQNRMNNTSLVRSFTAKFKRVTGVKLHTAGIIPVPIERKELGNIIMYDLAGQYEYYSSHAALLEQLVSSPGALLMVVVDLSKSKEEIIQQLQYWNSFIENHCSQSSSKPNIVIIGSHADVVKSQREDFTQKSTSILIKLSSSLQTLHEIIPLNCTQLESDGLTKVCNLIARKCAEFHHHFDIDLQVHFLYAFLFREFKSHTACRVLDIATRITEDKNAEMKVGEDEAIITLLPRDTATLSQHLTTLSEKGQFLYLRNDQNIEDSWVILDQEMLLSEVNGTVFAPENFKEHHDISSSTGVVPFSKFKEAFPTHNPEMIISFLIHLEFCQQSAKSEASVISGGGQLGDSQQPSETFYFFPALVSEDRPEESCKSIERTHYKCGWSLQCIRPDQFLSPRFLHVLLLRLAFSFALAPETAEEDKTCPVLQRRCDVWKAGIHWQNRDGVEAVVEVVEQNTAVTVMMGCLEGCEVACVRLRSEVIRTILDAKERFCGAVELRESLIHTAELSYPLKSPRFLPSFTITELAIAITEDKQVVTCKHDHGLQMLGISKLLHFEPYACFNSTLLNELFEEQNADKELPVRFLIEIGKTTHPKKGEFMTVLEVPVAAIDKAPSNCRDDPAHISMLMFRAWKTKKPTYQALRSALDQFSVFCGRNPLQLAGQVLFPQNRTDTSTIGTSQQSKAAHMFVAKTKPTTKFNDQDDTEHFRTIAEMSDRPRLQELQCLRGRGGRRVRVIQGVAAKWEYLADALHFESSMIEIVRRDTFHQTEAACREVLQRWLEGQEGTRQPVNWGTLIDSLLEAGFVDIAEDLQEVVGDSPLPPN